VYPARINLSLDILCSDVKHDVGQKLIHCAIIPFSVHELVKVAPKLVLMAATHPLEYSIPVGLGVDPSGPIYKLDGILPGC
jgi:hypothetical protein